MEINYIQLTTYSKNDPAGYKDFPKFSEDIWPLFIKNSSAIKEVIRIQSPSFFARMFKNADLTATTLGKMSGLSEEIIRELKLQSFYAGHLDVFYKTSAPSFITQMIKLYPYKKLGNQILFDKKKWELVQHAIVGLNLSSDILISFAHDGDPMFLFGEKNFLKKLLEISESE